MELLAGISKIAAPVQILVGAIILLFHPLLVRHVKAANPYQSKRNYPDWCYVIPAFIVGIGFIVMGILQLKQQHGY